MKRRKRIYYTEEEKQQMWELSHAKLTTHPIPQEIIREQKLEMHRGRLSELDSTTEHIERPTAFGHKRTSAQLL